MAVQLRRCYSSRSGVFGGRLVAGVTALTHGVRVRMGSSGRGVQEEEVLHSVAAGGEITAPTGIAVVTGSPAVKVLDAVDSHISTVPAKPEVVEATKEASRLSKLRLNSLLARLGYGAEVAATPDTTQSGISTPISATKAPAVAPKVVTPRARNLVLVRPKMKTLAEQIKAGHSLDANIESLLNMLVEFPESQSVACKHNLTSQLLKLVDSPLIEASATTENLYRCLALLGYHFAPLNAPGVNILAIDGGGMKGLGVLEILLELEQRLGRPVHDVFDLVLGCSTGSLVAGLVFVLRIPVADCVVLYRELGREVFSRNRAVGLAKLFQNHAWYDTEFFEKVLQKHLHETRLIDTISGPNSLKFATVSSVMNSPILNAYLFRNYSHAPSVISHYDGSTSYKVWQGVRASSAAPGYLEEYKLDGYVHQDGGLLTNNPAAVAIHESKLLWPGEDLNCVVSLGTGRFADQSLITNDYSSIKNKLVKFVQSATDTQSVHTILLDLLPKDSYYRFMPRLSAKFELDEASPAKLDQLVEDTRTYLRHNSHKLDKAVAQLSRKRRWNQTLMDKVKLFVDRKRGV